MLAMNLKHEDLKKITKLTSQQIYYVTCMECCKYYVAPETAPCGHTLCHMCWRERLTCPYCAKPVDRNNLKPNQPVQNLKENVQGLEDAFEKLFKIKVAEVLLDEEPEDPTKNVKDWLESSQNNFSAPLYSSGKSSQDVIEIPKALNVSSNTIQIHPNTTMLQNPKPGKAVYVPKISQDDWDKIEPLPDSEDITKKGKENVIGPMDIEPFYIDDENQYTANNPRRSSRKRDFKISNENSNNDKVSTKKDSKDSNEDTDQKTSTAKQNWNNVKRMRKEFSKLNKKNRNKLNISIEMCKKTPSVTKNLDDVPQPTLAHYDIDENTPNNNNLHTKESPESDNRNLQEEEKTEPSQISNMNTNNLSTNIKNQTSQHNSKQASSNLDDSSNPKINVSKKSDILIVQSTIEESSNAQSIQNNTAKTPFYKKSALNTAPTATNVINKIHHTVESNTRSNDDIEISIKVGNTIANILIKKKTDMVLKLNTEREIQTSLGLHSINEKTSPQNTVIKLGDNSDIEVKHRVITEPEVEELKKIGSSGIIVSEKKHTDSDDTATAQYEITASVEKELSKQMEVEEINEPERTKTITISTEKSNKSKQPEKTSNEQLQKNKVPVDEDEKSHRRNAQSHKASSNLDVDEYMHDVDIFDSEPIKEQQVQCLKNAEPAMSEILPSTTKSRKTQKSYEKRCRGKNDEDVLPKSKKAKCDDNSKTANVTAGQDESAQNQPDSEPINYDAVMGTVFANIDAEIGESQNIIKNTYTLEDKTSQNKNKEEPTQVEVTQEVDLPSVVNVTVLNKHKPKDTEKNDSAVTVHLTSLLEKMPVGIPDSNIAEFLTPVTSQPVDNDVPMENDDSDDKSIVEETPQKSSFTKVKKSNGGNRHDKNASQTQPEELPIQNQPSKPPTEDMDSIVSLTDTSMKSVVDETAIRKAPTETPLSIDKFVNQIQHKSTPFAKKSLNFGNQNDDVTLCATTEGVVNTTQEREFMLKAFEKTPTTVAKPAVKSLALKHKKFVIAGSSLSSREVDVLKRLCVRNHWTFQNQYTKELTHLVVTVDEENKANRTIKYMCALAASKWIVSYEWVAKCLQSKEPVNEEEFEVLDSTGEPGPMRSRLSTNKLFQGIKFFCMEPFGVVGVNNLKEMLTSAGGVVVDELKAVRVVDDPTPALMLAEPDNTQEDRFIYLALELGIVPVNYEWALNSLGSYTLYSIQNMLLCPSTLIPKATAQWPHELVAQSDDSSL